VCVKLDVLGVERQDGQEGEKGAHG
jgi:hypothetical protein